MYRINKPYLYNKDWRIFPQTILSNLQLDDCNDTVNGFCENTNTLKQCIDICANDPRKLCDGGYFIEADDRNYCVPLSSTSSEPSYPYYRFRNADAYPQLDNVKTTSFISTKYNFPPDISARLFYMDNIAIKNVKSNLQVSRDLNDPENSDIYMSDNNYINVQFVPENALRTAIEVYMPVLNGDSVAINIPNTGLLLEKTDNGLKWMARLNNKLNSQNLFKIFSNNPKKEIGQPLNYTESFYLVSSENAYLSVDQKNLTVSKESDSSLFRLIPYIKVYYCNDGDCKTVILKNTEMSGDKARYKNSMVYRMPECWNRCKKHRANWRIWVLIIMLVLLLGIFILIFKKK